MANVKPTKADDSTWLCVCGAALVPISFRAWARHENDWGEMRALSCPTPGCAGNVAEKSEQYVTAMGKLTDDEKKLLGLWNWNPSKNSVDVAAQLP